MIDENRPKPEPGAARVGVVLVNWKRAADTIECLESLLRSTIPLQVVVVDNASGDGSLETIAAWAAGTHGQTAASPAMAAFSEPAFVKPLPVVQMAADAAAATDPQGILTLIASDHNGGFAAGNNIGLRHLLRNPQLDYFWLLNNDTVVAAAAAAALLTRLDSTPRVGMCGTVVAYYWRPETVQALGGHRFNLWTGTSHGIGAGLPLTQSFDPAKIARETDFVLGASLAVGRKFLEAIGPMEQRYFLYFEEIDWATRSGDRFKIAFANGAVVYHKEGGSIGSSARPGERSPTSDYWLARSRLMFIRLHHPLLLPWHWVLTIGTAVRRLLRGHPAKALIILRALFGVKY